MWEGQRESADEKVDGKHLFLISLTLPVSEHCAPTVSIATAMEDLILKQGRMGDGGCSRVGGGCKGPRTGPGIDEIRICLRETVLHVGGGGGGGTGI